VHVHATFAKDMRAQPTPFALFTNGDRMRRTTERPFEQQADAHINTRAA
jgi:hypothetical protein